MFHSLETVQLSPQFGTTPTIKSASKERYERGGENQDRLGLLAIPRNTSGGGGSRCDIALRRGVRLHRRTGEDARKRPHRDRETDAGTNSEDRRPERRREGIEKQAPK